MGDYKKRIADALLAETRPDRFLKGSYPRLVDEWQEVPTLWDSVRAAVDEGGRGMFILTGSRKEEVGKRK